MIVWIDRVRSRAYQTPKTDGEQHREDRRADPQRDAARVGEVVGEQGADDADQHDGEPVDRRDVAPQPELDHQRRDQRRRVKTSVVLVRPKPRVSLM